MNNLEDWGIDGLIKKGGVMILNPKEDNDMKKLDFLNELEKILDWGINHDDVTVSDIVFSIRVLIKKY